MGFIKLVALVQFPNLLSRKIVQPFERFDMRGTATRTIASTTWISIFCVLCILPFSVLGSSSKPIYVLDEDGDSTLLYEGSYALLIGVSQYENDGWPDLDQIPDELISVKNALEGHGFEVTLELEKTSQVELIELYQSFISKYGYAEKNRLLFVFSGHGYTSSGDGENDSLGFLVPSDAPVPIPGINPGSSFFQRSLQMSQFTGWADQMQTNHVLFLFDSCFSGTIFKARNQGVAPEAPFRYEGASQKVRQFITSGSADELVPARSQFMRTFVDALTEDIPELTDDNVITGNELGLFIQENVRESQTPQFGKSFKHWKGNFLFLANPDNLHEQEPAALEKPYVLTQLKKEDDFLSVNLYSSETTFDFSHVYLNTDGKKESGYLSRNGGDYMLENGRLLIHDENSCDESHPDWCWSDPTGAKVSLTMNESSLHNYSAMWKVPLNMIPTCPHTIEAVADLTFPEDSPIEHNRIKNMNVQSINLCDRTKKIGDCAIGILSTENPLNSDEECIALIPKISRTLEGFSSWTRRFDVETKKCVFRFSNFASTESDCNALGNRILKSIAAESQRYDQVASGFLLNP